MNVKQQCIPYYSRIISKLQFILFIWNIEDCWEIMPKTNIFLSDFL